MDSGDVHLNTDMDELIDGPSEASGVASSSCVTGEGLTELTVTDDTNTMHTEEILDVGNEKSEHQLPKAGTVKVTKTCELPLSKIKGIMKTDPEVVMVASEAVFAVAKAAELFLQALAKQSYKHTAVQKKKTIQRSHVDSAVTGSDSLFFLEDALD